MSEGQLDMFGGEVVAVRLQGDQTSVMAVITDHLRADSATIIYTEWASEREMLNLKKSLTISVFIYYS